MKKGVSFRNNIFIFSISLMVISILPLISKHIFARSLNVPIQLNTEAIRKENMDELSDRTTLFDLYRRINNTSAYRDNEKYVLKRLRKESLVPTNGYSSIDISKNREEFIDPGTHYYPDDEKVGEDATKKINLVGDDQVMYMHGILCASCGIQAPDFGRYKARALKLAYERTLNVNFPSSLENSITNFLEDPRCLKTNAFNGTGVTDLNKFQKYPDQGQFETYPHYLKFHDPMYNMNAYNYEILKGTPCYGGYCSSGSSDKYIAKYYGKALQDLSDWNKYVSCVESAAFVFKGKKHLTWDDITNGLYMPSYHMKDEIFQSKYDNWPPYKGKPVGLSSGLLFKLKTDVEEMSPEAAYIITDMLKKDLEDQEIDEAKVGTFNKHQVAFWITPEGGGGTSTHSFQNLINANNTKIQKLEQEGKLQGNDGTITSIRKSNEYNRKLKRIDKDIVDKNANLDDLSMTKAQQRYNYIMSRSEGAQGLIAEATEFSQYWEKIKGFGSQGAGELVPGYAYHNDYLYADGRTAKNPQLSYKPGISSPIGSLQDSNTPKFDELNQQWIFGPYSIDYLEEYVGDKRATTLVDMELYGDYLNGPYDGGAHLNSQYSSVQPNWQNVNEARKIGKQKMPGSIKSWRISVQGSGILDSEYPRPGEPFYVEVDYDPTLIRVSRIEFEFMYMVYGARHRLYNTEYALMQDIEIKHARGGSAIINYEANRLSSSSESCLQSDGYYDFETKSWVPPTYSSKTRYSVYYPYYKVIPTLGGGINRVSLQLKSKVTKHRGQDQATERAARWFESCVVEYQINASLLIPIGGKVWEDKPVDVKKRVGFNHILDFGEKGIDGLHVKVYRVIAKFNSNKTKIEKILSKKIARVVTRNYQSVGSIFTDNKGLWGYQAGDNIFVHTVGLSGDERSYYGNGNVGVAFVVEYEYDGIYYEPVLPLQTDPSNYGPSRNIMVYEDGTSAYAKIKAYYRQDLYSNSSMAIEHEKERKEFNRKNAEFQRYESMDLKSHSTIGATNEIDENGKRLSQRKINYDGFTMSFSGLSATRSVSKYKALKPRDFLNGRSRESLSDSEYYNYKRHFIAAETLNIGVYQTNTWKFRYSTRSQEIRSNWRHDGIYVGIFNDFINFNLGLKERQAVDIGIIKNLSAILVSVNKKAYIYTYNDVLMNYMPNNDLENINVIQIKKDEKNVQLALDLYKTDYIYRTSMYSSSKDLYDALKNELAKESEKDELEKSKGALAKRQDTRQLDVFLMYKTSIYNDSLQDKVLISQIDEYYDNKLELVNKRIRKEIEIDPIREIEKYPGIRDNKRTRDGINLDRKDLNIIQPKFARFSVASFNNTLSMDDLIKSGDESVDVVTNENQIAKSKRVEFEKVGYKKEDRLIGDTTNTKFDSAISKTSVKITKANEKDHLVLSPNERIDMYLAFRVKNADDITKVEEKPDLNGVSKLNNALQIGKFAVATEIGSFATYDILDGRVSAKVDQDSAPGNLDPKVLEKSTKEYFEDDTDAASVVNLRLKKEDEKTKNDKKTKRTLEGLVWEDLRNVSNGGILTGDGKYDPLKEKTIPNMKITLEERISIRVDPKMNLKNLINADPKVREYIDIPFSWPEKIVADDIELDLKKATGFESHVETDKYGNYKFEGIPAGNFVVKMNYSSPGIKQLKELDLIRNLRPIDSKLIEKEYIEPEDLVHTVNANGEVRSIKYYNGVDFKNTMFYVDGGNNDYSKVQGKENPSNIAKTWLDKNIESKNASFLKDDEYRRIEVSQNLETFKNSIVDEIRQYDKEDIKKIDKEKLKRAHKLTMMVGYSPKINFSIEYYEKYKKDCIEAQKNNIWKEYQDLYALDGIYILGKENKENNKKQGEENRFKYNLHNLNLGIVQRPRVKTKLNKELSRIQLVTSDGRKIVDTKYITDVRIDVPTKDKLECNDYNYTIAADIQISRTMDKRNSSGYDSILSLDREAKTNNQGFRYINLDQNLMQNATIHLNYNIYTFNLSETDKKYDIGITDINKVRDEAYFCGESSGLGELNYQYNPKYTPGKYVGLEYYVLTNPTKNWVIKKDEVSTYCVKNLADFADNNSTVKLDEAENEEWKATNKKDLINLITNVNENNYMKAEYIDEKGIKYIDQRDENNIDTTRSNLYTLKNNQKKLYPITYLRYIDKKDEAELSEESYQVWNIRLDRTISNQADSRDLKFDNYAETLEYLTEDYNRELEETPGNVITDLDKINGNGDGEFPGNKKNVESNTKLTGDQSRYNTVLKENDQGTAEKVTITPPTGLSKKEIILTSSINKLFKADVILEIILLILIAYKLWLYIKIKKERK